MVQEAGGMVGAIDPLQDVMVTGDILAATPRIHDEMRAVLSGYPVH